MGESAPVLIRVNHESQCEPYGVLIGTTVPDQHLYKAWSLRHAGRVSGEGGQPVLRRHSRFRREGPDHDGHEFEGFPSHRPGEEGSVTLEGVFSLDYVARGGRG